MSYTYKSSFGLPFEVAFQHRKPEQIWTREPHVSGLGTVTAPASQHHEKICFRTGVEGAKDLDRPEESQLIGSVYRSPHPRSIPLLFLWPSRSRTRTFVITYNFHLLFSSPQLRNTTKRGRDGTRHCQLTITKDRSAVCGLEASF